MYVFIYFHSKLNIDRDDIEDALNEYLEEKGEVTGAGSGVSGSNIDVEIYDENTEEIIEGIVSVLRDLHVPVDTVLDIGGKKRKLYDS